MVKCIKAHRQTPQGVEYRVEWEGLPRPKDHTWEPLTHLRGQEPSGAWIECAALGEYRTRLPTLLTRVLNHRVDWAGVPSYMVHWKGQPRTAATWEVRSSLIHPSTTDDPNPEAPRALTRYESHHSLTPNWTKVGYM